MTSDNETLRRIQPDDIDSIAKIEQRCFEDPCAYSKKRLRYLSLKANSTCLVEAHGQNIVGFIIVTYRKGSYKANIETVDVDPSHQKQGIGLRLLAVAEDDMKNHGIAVSQLEVSEGNLAALRLYYKAGYKFKEAIKNFYKYNHHGTRNAVRLVKVIQ